MLKNIKNRIFEKLRINFGIYQVNVTKIIAIFSLIKQFK